MTNLTSKILNMSSSSSDNGTFLYESYKFSPNLFEWCLLIVAICIFFIGIIGNLLVVLVVARNHHMRTITNIFIVNLAIGDFLVILICLPPSIIQNFSGNWWFGQTMCKILTYVQYISVCVSVMTLTSISYERYYAIVYPLKFQATKFRAKVIIFFIWILACLVSLPHLIVIIIKEEDGIAYCTPSWDILYQRIFDLLIFSILYILPMVLIFYTYTRVVKVLWRMDKSIASNENEQPRHASSRREPTHGNNDNFDRLIPKRQCSVNYSLSSNSTTTKSKMKNQLIARRKAAKMLISVAVMFACCYLPIHTLNILRFTASEFLESLGNYAKIMFQIAQLLVYVNSSINPLIYNFMSDNFRKEFRKVLFCKSMKSRNLSNIELMNSEMHFRYVSGRSRNSMHTKNMSKLSSTQNIHQISYHHPSKPQDYVA